MLEKEKVSTPLRKSWADFRNFEVVMVSEKRTQQWKNDKDGALH